MVFVVVVLVVCQEVRESLLRISKLRSSELVSNRHKASFNTTAPAAILLRSSVSSTNSSNGDGGGGGSSFTNGGGGGGGTSTTQALMKMKKD